MIAFILQAVGISLSGVVSPGPMTAATIASGTKNKNAGLYVALGHAVVEFPLMVAIFVFADFLKSSLTFKSIVGLLGSLFLLYMGVSLVKSFKASAEYSNNSSFPPLLIGVFLSAMNPYFIIWWATIGAVLIFKSISYGIYGFVLFAVLHWLCDLFWYWFLSAASYKGRRVFGERFYETINIACGVFLILMGLKFGFDSLKIFVLVS